MDSGSAPASPADSGLLHQPLTSRSLKSSMALAVLNWHINATASLSILRLQKMFVLSHLALLCTLPSTSPARTARTSDSFWVCRQLGTQGSSHSWLSCGSGLSHTYADRPTRGLQVAIRVRDVLGLLFGILARTQPFNRRPSAAAKPARGPRLSPPQWPRLDTGNGDIWRRLTHASASFPICRSRKTLAFSQLMRLAACFQVPPQPAPMDLALIT